MSLLMHDIDGSEGRDNPPHVKRTRRVFPRPIYKASSACALRCSSAANSCENAVERSPLLIIFHEGFVKKTICKFGLHYKAISYNTVFGSDNERFQIANPVWLPYGPENGDFFRLAFSDIVFGSASSRKRGPFSDEIHIRKRHPDLVLHMSWEATRLVTSRKQFITVVVVIQDTRHTHQTHLL